MGLTYDIESLKGQIQHSDLGERVQLEDGSLYTVQVDYMTSPKEQKGEVPDPLTQRDILSLED